MFLSWEEKKLQCHLIPKATKEPFSNIDSWMLRCQKLDVSLFMCVNNPCMLFEQLLHIFFRYICNNVNCLILKD